MEKQIHPQMRAALFAQATRQHIQTYAPIPVVPGGTLSFDIHKSRYLSNISLLVNGTVTVAHASATTYTPSVYNPYNLIRNISVNINNGFSPFRFSGVGGYLYNRIYRDAEGFERAPAAARGKNAVGLVSSVGGTANTFRFWLDLPIKLNPRDPVGLINVQNPQTTVNVTIDFNALSVLADPAAGFTFTSALTLTPIVETFTIPMVEDHQPDLSILKLVHEYSQAIPAAGEVTFKFPVGRTYRRIIFQVLTAAGLGMADSAIGNIQIALNEADVPYSISAHALASINQDAYRRVLEPGVYVLDFTDQGVPNMGGARDYVDTERLTEFWLRFSTNAAGSVNIWAETLAILLA